MARPRDRPAFRGDMKEGSYSNENREIIKAAKQL